jgi:diguanylate cyclase (GGDEF)-like protein
VPGVDELSAAADRRVARQVTVAGTASPYLGVFSLVESHQATPAVLAVLLPLAHVEAARYTLLAVLAVLMVALAVGVVVIAYWSAGTFTVPLLRLAAAAQRMEAGELQVNVPNTSPHELGKLERAFSTMAETLRAREQTLAALVSQLELRAMSDELTGLPNRTALQERLDRALSSGDPESPVALLLIDLDRFKEVNDTLGHQAGDAVLLQVARRFRDALSTSDTVARLGGDEFAVLLPATNLAGAVHVAKKLRAALEAPVLFLGRPLNVGASIGIATRLGPEDGAAALLRRSDVAMYAAKRGRTGYACYAVDQDDHSPDRLMLLGELRQAITANQLVLHFQPKVSLETGRIVHAEALVRWQHPQHGLLAPDRFIPLAEQTGLIAPLTDWVLDAALRQARVWRERGRAIPVAVNVSVQNLDDPRLAASVAELLDRYGVPPRDLIVEITETSVLVDPARATEVLGRLRTLGVRVAIDDFGAGQSALGYLKQLPADELKIDRSFIRDLQHNDRDAAIVRAAIELGHSLGLSVVAEGVEDEVTWDQLASLGCDVAQGYFMARPLTADDLETWLRTSRWGHNPRGHLHRAA